MAVYTKLSNQQVDKILSNYDIGTLKELKGIEAGIENSNFFMTTAKDKYILTVYEKRVKESDLPFYLELMRHLARKGVPCPLPVENRDSKLIYKVENKPCAVVSFLSGSGVDKIENYHMEELGKNMALMHNAALDFPAGIKNAFSIDSWSELFEKIGGRADEVKEGLAREIEAELRFLEKNWPKNLPEGIIHGDLFPDNVFFEGQNLVGIIDFYFACRDFLMYDIAICLNAWCFEDKAGDFNLTKAKKMLDAYNKVRKINEEELDALPIMAAGSALRFLLTRLYDWVNWDKTALVKHKDPLEYLRKLRFHKGIKSHKEYGL